MVCSQKHGDTIFAPNIKMRVDKYYRVSVVFINKNKQNVCAEQQRRSNDQNFIVATKTTARKYSPRTI